MTRHQINSRVWSITFIARNRPILHLSRYKSIKIRQNYYIYINKSLKLTKILDNWEVTQV